MIRIELIGNLGADAAQIQSPRGGEPFVSFRIACTENKGDHEVTHWLEATTGLSGNFDYLKKGKRVYIEGIPEVSSYVKKDGKAEARIVVRVKNLELL